MSKKIRLYLNVPDGDKDTPASMARLSRERDGQRLLSVLKTARAGIEDKWKGQEGVFLYRSQGAAQAIDETIDLIEGAQATLERMSENKE